MKKDRNCGGGAMPIMYGGMPMPNNMPLSGGMPMMIPSPGMMQGNMMPSPGMMQGNMMPNSNIAQVPNVTYQNTYNFETQMNNIQQQLNVLEDRLNKLEGKTGTNSSNKYSDSNYYML